MVDWCTVLSFSFPVFRVLINKKRQNVFFSTRHPHINIIRFLNFKPFQRQCSSNAVLCFFPFLTLFPTKITTHDHLVGSRIVFHLHYATKVIKNPVLLLNKTGFWVFFLCFTINSASSGITTECIPGNLVLRHSENKILNN